jgi:hypothetical protein
LRAILNIDPRILATSLALLVIALVLLARRRVMVARIRREREAELAAQASDGETSVLPLAHLASAVEVLDLDDLLAGEEGSVAAAARRQLEEPTNVSTAPDTFFPLPSVPASRPAAAAAVLQMAAAVAPAVAVADRRPAASAMMPAEAGAAAAERVVPVRELALAWFEARGYRPSNASQAVRPIELVLRHRKDPARAYAFIVEMERVNAERATALVNHAHSIGLTRVLVAAEGGIEPGTRHKFRRQGVRLVDQDEMRREFDKLDLRVAAKIIAVARSRSRLRKEVR